jgi:hypothetical protein
LWKTSEDGLVCQVLSTGSQKKAVSGPPPAFAAAPTSPFFQDS